MSTYALAKALLVLRHFSAADPRRERDEMVGAISVLLPLERARDLGYSASMADAVRETARDVSREIGAAQYPFCDNV